MALTLGLLTSGSSGNAHGTGSVTTASFTPSNNSLLVVILGEVHAGSGDSTNLTVSGGSLTYSAAVTMTRAGFAEARAWTAPVATGASMTITFDCGADDIYVYKWAVFEFTGYDTGDPVDATGTAQQGDGSGNSVNGALTLTLDAAPASSSYVLAAMFVDADPSAGHGVVVGTGFTEELLLDSASDHGYLSVQSRTGSTSTAAGWNDTVTGGSASTHYSAGALALEIVEGSSGITGTVAETLDAFTSTASGTVDPVGSVAETLDPFISTASGAVVNPTTITYVKEVGFVTNATAGTTSTITVASGGVPVGDHVVVYGACDNTGGSGAATTITVTDTRSNTWATQSPQAIADPGATSAGSQGFLAITEVSTAMQAGDTITITYGNSTTVKAINAQQFSGVHQGTAVLTGTYATQDNQTGTTSSVAATPTTAGQAVCALISVEGGTDDSFTEDSDTTNGSWVTLTRRGTGTGATGMTLNSVYKIVNASGAQTYNPTLGTARDHCAAILVLNVNHSGTSVNTLGSFTSTASGTVSQEITGTVTETLDPFTSTASGSSTPPAITGTVAVTLGDFDAFGVEAVYPASISGRKILDQSGNVYLMPSMSSWALTTQLTEAEITTALEGVAALGFKAITTWVGGGYEFGPDPNGWNRYETEDALALWSGTPWASSLGAGFARTDHVLDECLRLGLAVNLSFCGGNGTSGAGPDWEAVTNTNMYDAGVAIATRYPVSSYPNIVWHIMLDDSTTTGSTRGTRIQNLFDGINDTEGASARPVRWLEPNNGSSIDAQGWLGVGFFNCSMNGWYDYDTDAAVIAETSYAEDTGVPTGDTESAYDGDPNYNGASGHQQMRERCYATFFEGGVYMNYSQCIWWAFGASSIYTETGVDTWEDVLTHSMTLHASYAWSLIDSYCKDATWAPTSSFVTTGEGSTDTKAAIGASSTAALAYFPTSRTVEVDTTIIAGSTRVRLRWYDPTDGTFDLIVESEAQQPGRSVSYPSAHADTTNDWVLVVDEAPGDGQAAITLAPFTSTAAGTFTPPTITGTVAETLNPFTSTASGTAVSFIGTLAETLDPFTSTASGTSTPPAFTGTVAETLDPFTSTASGTVNNPGFAGNGAVTLAPFVAAAAGTFTPPPITGTVAVTLGSFIANGQEGESTNITVVIGPPAFVTRSVTHDTVDRQAGANNTPDRVSGVPEMADRFASHTMVTRDANDPDTVDRSATIALGHGSPDPPTF